MDQEKVNILLVDDQPAKLLAYEVILKELGENLVKASSGREALEFLLKNDVAIILVDERYGGSTDVRSVAVPWGRNWFVALGNNWGVGAGRCRECENRSRNRHQSEHSVNCHVTLRGKRNGLFEATW